MTRSATFSPDGSKIAFTTDRDGQTQIYVMKPDGSEQKRLHVSQSNDEEPAWSPDGKWIAFRSDRDGKRSQLYVMKADGSDPRRLTNVESGGTMEPSWSPDGSAISFTGDWEGHQQIYRIDVDGENLINLSNSSTKDFAGDWGPTIKI